MAKPTATEITAIQFEQEAEQILAEVRDFTIKHPQFDNTAEIRVVIRQIISAHLSMCNEEDCPVLSGIKLMLMSNLLLSAAVARAKE